MTFCYFCIFCVCSVKVNDFFTVFVYFIRYCLLVSILWFHPDCLLFDGIYQVGSIIHLKVSNFAVTQSLYTMQAQGFGCLHYAMTRSVYFLVPSEGRHNDYFLMACVFLMQPLGMSTLCRDSDCLLYAGTWTVYFVQSPWVIKKTMCLLYDFTQTVYFLMASVYTMMA